MRAISNIVPGRFFGADIEPGTFHHWVPRGPNFEDPAPDGRVNADRAPDGAPVHNPPDGGAVRVTSDSDEEVSTPRD
jgi:hypothetical protein